MATPITTLALAEHRLGRRAATGSDFEEAGLPITGGCEICQASIAGYNSCPSRSGWLRCATGCIADEGFATAAEANAAIFGAEQEQTNPLWDDDLTQFARLICEIQATIEFGDGGWNELLSSMDLEPSELESLFARADTVWRKAKEAL